MYPPLWWGIGRGILGGVRDDLGMFWEVSRGKMKGNKEQHQEHYTGQNQENKKMFFLQKKSLVNPLLKSVSCVPPPMVGRF